MTKTKEQEFIDKLLGDSDELSPKEEELTFDFLEKLKLSNLTSKEEQDFFNKVKKEINSYEEISQEDIDKLEKELLSHRGFASRPTVIKSKKTSTIPSKVDEDSEIIREDDLERISKPVVKSNFAAAVLRNAKKDLGVKEDPNTPNDGPRIRQYFKNFGFNSGPGFPWCAAAVSTWMKEAGGGPIPGSMGSLQIMQQFKSAGLWKDKKDLKPEDLVPGNIAVWDHPEIGPGRGHVGVIASSNGGGGFTSISGNTRGSNDYNPNQVAIHNHSISDGNFLGLGMLSNYQ